VTPAQRKPCYARGVQLDAAIAEAVTRWPELADAGCADRFAEAVTARIEGELDGEAAAARLALPDLYLVTAVLAGHRGALAVLERLVRQAATRATGKLRGLAPEDVVQELLVKLLVPPGKLAAFGGHGALHAWLKVAAVRTALSLMRKKQPELDDDALAAIADSSDDQALAFMKQAYRAEFKRAFAATVGELPRRARTLLRLQIIDQLTLEEIAAFYAVSRATVARQLADARALLVAGTRDRVSTTLAITPAELSDLMRLVASSLYQTLPPLLAISRT
jgi:RNA polymerase sigma-70 factor (ECF subfamily)